jgi:hypothetical protein
VAVLLQGVVAADVIEQEKHRDGKNADAENESPEYHNTPPARKFFEEIELD